MVLASTARAFVTHIMSTPVLGSALVSGFVATAGYLPTPLAAQATAQAAAISESPNYRLAGRFAPYKIEELIHSTSVEPNWIENSERFWYSWETGDGKRYYLVDPEVGTKTEIFDNDRIAAELTRITRDPWDGRHLPIRNIRFMDETTLQFDTSQEEDDDEAPVEPADFIPLIRRSLTAQVAIPAGAEITPAMIEVKRPGTGIGPAHMDEVVGARAARDIAADETLQWDAIAR